MLGLQAGDVINIDVTVYLDGYHGDCSNMFTVGQASPDAIRLIKANRRALEDAIKVCGPGVPFKEIGAICEKVKEKPQMVLLFIPMTHSLPSFAFICVALRCVALNRRWPARRRYLW